MTRTLSINPAGVRGCPTFIGAAFLLLSVVSPIASQPRSSASRPANTQVSSEVLLRIVRAEDERRWDKDLLELFGDKSPAVRKRAALAAGRIGNELAVPPLISLLQSDEDDGVQSMAAFALGEVESPAATEALTEQLSKRDGSMSRARIVEALGKIAAALPQTNEEQKKQIGKTILGVLNFEAQRRSRPDTDVILLALTAALRARPEGAGKVVAEFLSNSDPRIRSDAGNTLARLRAKDGNEELRKLLTSDPDPNVRANAARVLGATEDKAAVEGLLNRALQDPDSRVRVSAIRALGSVGDQQIFNTLLERGKALSAKQEKNEVLEIVTTLGRVGQNSKSQLAIDWLKQLRSYDAPEVEIAFARISPQLYSVELQQLSNTTEWRRQAAIGSGAAEVANVKSSDRLLDASIKNEALRNVSNTLSCPSYKGPRSSGIPNVRVRPGMVLTSRCTPLAIMARPDALRAYAAFKPNDLGEVLRKHLTESDVTVRTTAAELLGELPFDATNIQALEAALKVALRDKDSNDAALAIIDALAKQKNRNANQAIKAAIESSDYLTRRKAVESLKLTGAGDFSTRVGAPTRNSAADYARAISRIGKRVLAVVSTSKGPFTIEFLPDEAPLNVDNFVQLARRGYFNGIVFHRVVPNFVVQGGDPRGDGNGGPGYQIRCEINEVPYDRGAVGMALSGKDTGGSQWFVTHAPQPHLDGGYTVFGRVVQGMDVVDRIVRGDKIRSVKVSERGAKTIGTR